MLAVPDTAACYVFAVVNLKSTQKWHHMLKLNPHL